MIFTKKLILDFGWPITLRFVLRLSVVSWCKIRIQCKQWNFYIQLIFYLKKRSKFVIYCSGEVNMRYMLQWVFDGAVKLTVFGCRGFRRNWIRRADTTYNLILIQADFYSILMWEPEPNHNNMLRNEKLTFDQLAKTKCNFVVLFNFSIVACSPSLWRRMLQAKKLKNWLRTDPQWFSILCDFIVKILKQYVHEWYQ